MRALLFRRPTWLFVAPLLLVLVGSIAVHPFGRVKQPKQAPSTVNDVLMPLEVKTIVARACQDCHSNQTVWPWYSYVSPVSWLVERDVRRGRDRLNLSYWSQYSFDQRSKLLADFATVVKNHEMPLPQYALIHPHARLSGADINTLYQWARLERRKLRTISRK